MGDRILLPRRPLSNRRHLVKERDTGSEWGEQVTLQKAARRKEKGRESFVKHIYCCSGHISPLPVLRKISPKVRKIPQYLN